MTKKIEIDGMSCKHCVARVENALKENKINNADVKIGSVTADFGGLAETEIKDIIETLGFDVVSISDI